MDLHGRLPRIRRRPADRVAHLVLPPARRRRRVGRRRPRWRWARSAAPHRPWRRWKGDPPRPHAPGTLARARSLAAGTARAPARPIARPEHIARTGETSAHAGAGASALTHGSARRGRASSAPLRLCWRRINRRSQPRSESACRCQRARASSATARARPRRSGSARSGSACVLGRLSASSTCGRARRTSVWSTSVSVKESNSSGRARFTSAIEPVSSSLPLIALCRLVMDTPWRRRRWWRGRGRGHRRSASAPLGTRTPACESVFERMRFCRCCPYTVPGLRHEGDIWQRF
jgi:hypothetical protein